MNELPRRPTEFSFARATGTLIVVLVASTSLGLLGCVRSVLDQTPQAGRMGDPLPTLEPAAWINHEPEFSPASLTGRVLVVEAFATWCGPCRAMAPAMVQLQQEFSGQPDAASNATVQFISLTPETNEDLDAIRQFISDHGLSWPVGIGAESTLNALGTQGLPTVWVVGVDGRIAWRHAGWSGSGDLAELRSAIAQAQQNQTDSSSVPQ